MIQCDVSGRDICPVPVPYPAFKILVSNTQIDLIFEKLISGRVVTVTHIGAWSVERVYSCRTVLCFVRKLLHFTHAINLSHPSCANSLVHIVVDGGESDYR